MAISNRGESEFLTGLPPFQEFSASLRTLLASIGKRQTTPARGWIPTNAGPGTSLVVLLSGRARLSLTDHTPARVMLGYVHPGEVFLCFCEPKDEGHSMRAQALEASTVISWSFETLILLAEKHPQLTRVLLSMQGRKLAQLARRLLDASIVQLPARVARAILCLCERSGRPQGTTLVARGGVSLRDLAEMAGTTRSTVCRLLGRWRRLGILGQDPERMIVLKPVEMEKVARFHA